MTENSLQTESARIDAEIADLKEQLRTYEERIHGDIKNQADPNWNRVRGIDNRIRDIVLRLVELEREQIELRIASAQ
jgi:hypothetical protein